MIADEISLKVKCKKALDKMLKARRGKVYSPYKIIFSKMFYHPLLILLLRTGEKKSEQNSKFYEQSIGK